MGSHLNSEREKEREKEGFFLSNSRGR